MRDATTTSSAPNVEPPAGGWGAGGATVVGGATVAGGGRSR